MKYDRPDLPGYGLMGCPPCPIIAAAAWLSCDALYSSRIFACIGVERIFTKANARA